jgi:tetratricopeptide (TPR) repeat protein
MSESREQKIARLMAEGLDHYGQDLIAEAVQCWRSVLDLDPQHQVALDYLDAAGYTGEAAPAAATAGPSMADTAQAHLDSGEWLEALEALNAHTEKCPEDLDAHARLELLRSHLHATNRLRVGDGAGIPRVALGPDQVLRFNLPANAGFVLSMIDGHTSVSDLVALTGMDPFDALHVFTRLLDAGIVEVQA